MSKHTENDFAYARFAEHPDGRLAMRSGFYSTKPWEDSMGTKYTDEVMVGTRFSIVPSVPTFTQGEWGDAVLGQPKEWMYGFTSALNFMGAQCAPDPEPTNKQKLVDFVRKSSSNLTPAQIVEIAQYFDESGVKAPEADDE